MSSKLEDLPDELLEQCFRTLQTDPMPQAGIGYFSNHALGALELSTSAVLANRDALNVACRLSKRLHAICTPLLYEFVWPRPAAGATARGPARDGTDVGSTPYEQIPQACPLALQSIRHWSIDFKRFEGAFDTLLLRGRFDRLTSIDLNLNSPFAPAIVKTLAKELGEQSSINRASFCLGTQFQWEESVATWLLRDVILKLSQLKHLRLLLASEEELVKDFPVSTPLGLETLQLSETPLRGYPLIQHFLTNGIRGDTVHSLRLDTTSPFRSSSRLEDLPESLRANVRHLRIAYDHKAGLPHLPPTLASTFSALETLSLHCMSDWRGLVNVADYGLPNTLRVLHIHVHEFDFLLFEYLIRELGKGSGEKRLPLLKIHVWLDGLNDCRPMSRLGMHDVKMLRAILLGRGADLEPPDIVEKLEAVVEKRADENWLRWEAET